MTKMKAKKTYDYKNTSDRKKDYMNIFILQRPGKPLRILNRSFFYEIMKIVLNNGSSCYKQVVTQRVERKLQ